MQSRLDLIKKLLNTFHLNNTERQDFKQEPIKLEEIREVIQASLNHHAIFPETASHGKTGEAIFEGHFIEKLNDGKFKLLWQRHQAINPFELAEKFQKEYDDFSKLVHDYIEMEYKFNIDGLPILIK